ncbi:hypothetical protein [Kribbella deserti]|uniref:Autotransporter-associated beta strand protein n=1 Tax=Kribbella deserti TaxID=1926257 RepID=A0ABV6QFA7_9ACTN
MPAPTFVSSSGPNSFTTSTSALNFPATKTTGDKYLLGIIYEGPASNVGSISGWGSKILTASGGGMFLDVYVRDADPADTGSIGTISVPGGTSSQAAVAVYRSSTGVLTVGATSFGVDSTSGTAYSATTGSLTTAADMLIAYIFAQNGVGTHSGRTLTQAGATLGTLTNRFNAAGASVRQEFGDRPVTTGATAAIVHGCTLSVAATGLTGVVLLSEGTAEAHSGSLDLTGDGALTTAGAPAPAGTLGLSGTGAASTGAAPAIPGAVALSGAGQFAGAGAPGAAANVALSGGGALAVAGVPGHTGAAGFAGEGTLSATAPLAHTGDLVLGGAGQLTASGAPTVTGAATLEGQGALSLQGRPEPKETLQLAGTGHLTATGAPSPAGALGLAGAADLDFTGAADFPVIQPGLLVATNGPASVLTASNQPTSTLEASHGV